MKEEGVSNIKCCRKIKEIGDRSVFIGFKNEEIIGVCF